MITKPANDNRVAGHIEHGGLLADALFRTPALGDVANDGDDVIAIEVHDLGVEFDGKSRAVRAPMDALPTDEPGGAHLPDNVLPTIRREGIVDVEDAAREILLAGAAQLGRPLGVDVEKARGVRIDHFDGVVRLVDEVAKKFELFLRFMALSDVLMGEDHTAGALGQRANVESVPAFPVGGVAGVFEFKFRASTAHHLPDSRRELGPLPCPDPVSAAFSQTAQIIDSPKNRHTEAGSVFRGKSDARASLTTTMRQLPDRCTAMLALGESRTSR